MKKIILTALTIVLIISLTSCSTYTCATYSKHGAKKDATTKF